jgi:hypothetical protein
MSVAGATMARSKPRLAGKTPDPIPTSRTTIINLKGSEEQARWLEAIRRKTHISKTVIVRLALKLWAEQNEHEPFPELEDDE